MGVSREYAARLEVAVLIAWLMKDFAWVLLMHLLAWPAALAAITLQFHSMVMEWKTASDAVNVHALAALLWILGNAIWMTSELLWDSSSSYDKIAKHSVIPWHAGPLAGTNEQAYTTGVRHTQAVFITALLGLVAFYVVAGTGYISSASAAKTATNPQEDSTETVRQPEPLVWGVVSQEVYLMLYIGPWILKDLFWTLEMLCPALICSGIVFVLMFDGFRRFGSNVSLVELNWVIGNTFWLTAELGMQIPVLWLRLVAGGFLLLGCTLTVKVYKQAIADSRKEDARTVLRK